MGRSITARLLDAIYELSGVRLGADVFPATRDTETAVASVLALAALSDGSVSTEESERLVIILRRNFDLEAGTALALITRVIHELPVHDGMSKLLKELNSPVYRWPAPARVRTSPPLRSTTSPHSA